ncbi:MAG: hypothetical protein EXS05_11760 [Planctomycetaceae bacterium]|nr:hypothetical protein [Planctomycetaceae bacterium]
MKPECSQPAEALIGESVGDVSGTPAPGPDSGRGRNNLRHGCFAVGKMPAGSSYVAKLLGAMRRQVEAFLIQRDGEVGLMATAVVNELLRHERRALLLSRWLNTEPLGAADRVSILRDISSATTARNKCLRELGFDAKPKSQDVWACLSQPAKPVQAIAAPPASNTVQASTVDSGGILERSTGSDDQSGGRA